MRNKLNYDSARRQRSESKKHMKKVLLCMLLNVYVCVCSEEMVKAAAAKRDEMMEKNRL